MANKWKREIVVIYESNIIRFEENKYFSVILCIEEKQIIQIPNYTTIKNH